MARSGRDQISEVLSSNVRAVQDVLLDELGTWIQLLRISKGESDVFGYVDTTYDSEVINNCLVSYPFNEIELFSRRTNQNSPVFSISMAEILPITLWTKFEGEYASDPVELEEGDILVDIVKDHKGTKLPITMEVEKLIGGFDSKNLISRKYELSLSRNNYDSAIQQKIDNFVNNYEDPDV